MKRVFQFLLLLNLLLPKTILAAELSKAELVSPMPRGFFVHQSVVVKDYLYIIGGHGSGKRLADVYFSKISTDGKLSPWQKTTPLPEGKTGTMAHSATIYKDYIYCLAGTYKDFSDKKWKPTSTVVFAKVNDDGTITEWQEAPPVPEAQSYGMAVTGNGYIYFLSGHKSRQVYFAKIKKNGSLGKWQTTQNLISPR